MFVKELNFLSNFLQLITHNLVLIIFNLSIFQNYFSKIHSENGSKIGQIDLIERKANA